MPKYGATGRLKGHSPWPPLVGWLLRRGAVGGCGGGSAGAWAETSWLHVCKFSSAQIGRRGDVWARPGLSWEQWGRGAGPPAAGFRPHSH